MKCQECRAHLLPVPLSYWMGPEEPPIPPAANLKSWWHIRDLCQIDTENLQQTSRITANRDPGPDFPKFGVLLKNLHRYRLLQQASRKRKATYAPTNNGNLALADHICCSPRYGPGHRPGTRPRPIVCLLLTAGLGRGGPGGRRHAPQPAPRARPPVIGPATPVGGHPAFCSTPSQRGCPRHLIHRIARHPATRHR